MKVGLEPHRCTEDFPRPITGGAQAALRPAHLLLAGVTLLLAADPVWASVTFPRGQGYYFSPFKIFFLLVVYVSWVHMCGWVSRDLKKTQNETMWWMPLFIGIGFIGFLIMWASPFFYLSWLLLASAVIGVSLWYVSVRNELVDPEDKVLTEAHVRGLIRHYLRMDLGQGKEEVEDRPTVKFIGRARSGRIDGDEDHNVNRVADSKGYRAAQDMINDALTQRATDIHLEPTKDVMTVRFRIDGMMTAQEPFSRTMGDAVINIFKVIANLDITEKRKPQDGGLSAEIDDRPIEIRVATAGSVVGEKMVMRVLDASQKMLTLTQLGMREKMRTQVKSVISQPHGMFLVCGPTGSGKTSTLYACLNEIDRFQSNVITIENPVEYRLDNVTQIEINPKMGKTFASELRSILRQDPDVILVGEIRDQETAEIAFQAAQTGHLLYSSIHANDAVTAIGRLIDLGVEPFMIASALGGIIGQRLVRLLCPTCKVRYKPNPELLRKANLPAEKIKYFYRPPNEAEREKKGECPTCESTGYFKRTGIFELLVINDRIRELIKANPNLAAIKQEAVKGGMRYLYEDGLRQVIDGKTSIQELLRVSK
jgi:general secretion pathway protein E